MKEQQHTAVPATSSIPFPTSGQAWYLVFVLLIFYIFAFIDRQILSLLIGPLRRDLEITDSQVGLLGGFAFAIFYTFLGIPIGRLADRINRKSIIAVGVVLWSLMATLCGLARTFWQFFWARVGVGVGEAALSPPAYSMITDAFPREKVGRAFSVYNMGIAIGSGLSYYVVALIVAAVPDGQAYTLPLIGEVRGWQVAFVVTGAPGLLLPLLLLSVRDPARRGLMKIPGSDAGQAGNKIPLKQVVAYMVRSGHFYSLHFLAMAMMSLLGYAVGFWLPETMARTYEIPVARVGQILGLSTMIINTIGIFVAGLICDRLTKKGYTDAPIIVCFGTAVAVAATAVLPPFMGTTMLGLTMMCVAGFPFHGYVAMGPMAVNQVTPNQMRAQISAVYLFTVNLLGQGIGPWAVGAISTHILRDPSKIRYALVSVVIVAGTIAAILAWFARKPYRERLATTAEWQH